MVSPLVNSPSTHAGFRVWSVDTPSTTIRFVGRGPHQERQIALQAITVGRTPRLSWLQQTHSTMVRTASAGPCGEGDGLVTSESGLALSIATADCLPVVIAGDRYLAVVHAGWRGLAAGIIPAALRKVPERPESLRIWIGPAIAACCYEVGSEVAEKVASASGPEVIVATSGQPHLDLIRAAEIQLARQGVTAVSSTSTCTRCSPDWLESYRRDGSHAGRNWTFAWRRSNEEE